jgi:multidrug efflux pump
MVGLGIVPQPGSNYIEIADEFYKRYEQLRKEVPEDFRLNIALDNTRFVRRSIGEVGETLAIAFVLVILIIYLFFRDWLIALRPLIDIPVSLIGAFFIMYVFGFSINILTLLAIVLATGLVVDDGIVVTENIYKKLESGMRPMEAALKGSNEIIFAVVSTSITLAVVFLPIIFLPGFTGRLFREFGVVMAGAVLISAFVSLTLTPVLNVKLTRKNHAHSRFYELTEPFFVSLTDGYQRSLTNFMTYRAWAFAILGGTVVLGVVLWLSLQSELAPLEDRSLARVLVTTPEGTSYEYMEHYMDRLTQVVQDSVPEKRICLTIVAPNFAGSGAVNTGFLRIAMTEPDQRERSQSEIAAKLTKDLAAFNEGRTFVIQEQTISVGVAARTSLPIQYVLQNNDFGKLKEFVPKFMAEAVKDPAFQAVDVNLKFNKPELNVTIDRERARALGVSVLDVARTLQLAYGGGRMSYFTREGKQYQVIGQVDREDRSQPLDLRSLYVRSQDGTMIQMDELLKVAEANEPPQLYHFNRYMSATISASPAPGKTIGDGIDAMDAIGKKVLDPSFATSLSGASREFAESGSNIAFAFGWSISLSNSSNASTETPMS